MKIAVVGTGYVGLVTGVCLSEINHQVTCIDVNKEKVKQLKRGESPIHEPGLSELIKKNIKRETLKFTSNHKEGFKDAEVIFIAVGTPQLDDGSANLDYVKEVAKSIGQNILKNTIVVTKSTVPVGTNYMIERIINENIVNEVKVKVASNPEFLREGSAIEDTFHGDRIVIGTDDEETALVLETVYKPLGLPIFKTDIYSSEMIKYASNAFLATKISFINEISNICEKLGANIEDVANGMGYDQRIGRSFLNAGIGYGGSCFPKDTHALVQIAGGVEHNFKLLKSVIEVNNIQQKSIIKKIKSRIGNLKGIKVAILGLAFKPNTDDMRESASIPIIKDLISQGAVIKAYDPIAINNARAILPETVEYKQTLKETLEGSEIAIIITEWEEFKRLNLNMFKDLMKMPILFDGRNCFDLDQFKDSNIEYFSMGRPPVNAYMSSNVKELL
ncbi:UDP-glucose dehydrogenase family protein [Priestia megaterium]|uniref:UDP-glucose dehydrogenase family protein n=1 Tax=Priestia megaterium TaxID=1404 RepID=UPI002452AEFE|nr:UDP-glucose/GDP-mannose dehydrogenase family protein [Priestia megaterium]MDH3159701.1 UDP-glucose/GDP-mannose dehydrogenase family protein [Priestia megaterium]MED4113706.1 UDP-glucose/GDP-mannose dehydrogenase family protein [Priestia megaterium]